MNIRTKRILAKEIMAVAISLGVGLLTVLVLGMNSGGSGLRDDTVIHVYIVYLLAAFPGRYLYYGVKWALTTLEQPEQTK